MEILEISSKRPNQAVEEVVKEIKKGNVVVCPTDTVYGVLADATNEKAVERIFKIKIRQRKKPIPVFVKDIKMAKKLAFIDKEQEKFLKKVWPGKITVVFKRKTNSILPKILFGGKKTIGLRIPDYELINILLKKINKPLTGTSANISGQSASTKIKEVLKQIEGRKNQPDLVINAGNLLKSSPSTVIDLTKSKAIIQRRGEFKKL